MRFEMYVDVAGPEKVRCLLAICLDPDPDQEDPLTISVYPVGPDAAKEMWETTIDINREQTTQLRAALSAMLEVMK